MARKPVKRLPDHTHSWQELYKPYGQQAWHFQEGPVHEGNGFNGAIKHLWHAPAQMTIPGKGIVSGE